MFFKRTSDMQAIIFSIFTGVLIAVSPQVRTSAGKEGYVPTVSCVLPSPDVNASAVIDRYVTSTCMFALRSEERMISLDNFPCRKTYCLIDE
jgi:hypothetical protein